MPKDTAGSAIWTIGKLVQAVKDKAGTGTTRIEIPRFQRHLVWNAQQRVDLIDSIHKGYPIGSIMLFKRFNPGSPHEVFQVVDGLQRTSTLVHYAERPLTYVPIDLFPAHAMSAIASALDVEEEHLQRAITDWMRETERLTFSAGFAPNKLVRHLADSLEREGAKSNETLIDLVGSALDELKTAVDISSVSLPVVTYSGSEGELPEIFERVNQSGTKLNKYEVFAATWLNSATLVQNSDIRIAVNEKYNSLLVRGYNISGLEKDKAIQDFNLFEYLFGLGKWIVREHGLLFKEKSDPAETEPAAFSLTCICLGQQLARMGQLPEFMPKAADSVIDPAKMEVALRTAATAVEKWLRPFISLRLNSTTDKVDLAHGELQIVSMIARAVVGRWDSRGDWSELPNWQDDWKKLEHAMPQHYLMDLIEETWRGPIYTTLFNRVWETDESGAISSPSGHYEKGIPWATWDNSLEAWFAKQIAREQRSRPYVRPVDRVFLRYVYAGIVTYQENAQQDYELEHLYPVARLKELISEDEQGWPISCIANLALFTKALNREKSKQTISEHLEENPLPPAEHKALEKLLLCNVSDVAITEGFDLTSYRGFLTSRWSKMKTTLMYALKVAKNPEDPSES